jgi:hypothetical protein
VTHDYMTRSVAGVETNSGDALTKLRQQLEFIFFVPKNDLLQKRIVTTRAQYSKPPVLLLPIVDTASV